MNIKKKYYLEVWIGLAKVKSNNKSSFQHASNGYVNVLGLSNSKDNFRKKVQLALQKNGLKLVRFEVI